MDADPGWTIGRLARATGLSVRVLRHWDEIGVVSPSRTHAGHRRYAPADVVRLYRAVALRRAGLRLEQVRDLVADADPDPGATLRAHLADLESDLRRRTALRDRLRDALADGPATGPDPTPLMAVIARLTLLDGYVHGYHAREGERLRDQASTLAGILHRNVRYGPGEEVLEVGCGVGAQTAELLRRSPGAAITSVDRSGPSLREARERVGARARVAFLEADVHDLPRPDGPLREEGFDHAFVCFLLEHLARPVDVLRTVRRMIRPGGTVTVIEGDHGSTRFHPDSPAAHRAIEAQIHLQARNGGDALIGPKLPALLAEAGFADVTEDATEIAVNADTSPPELVDGFIRNTFTAMIAGIREPAIAAGLVDATEFDAGVADLLATADPGGRFAYTFTVATGVRPARRRRARRDRPTRGLLVGGVLERDPQTDAVGLDGAVLDHDVLTDHLGDPQIADRLGSRLHGHAGGCGPRLAAGADDLGHSVNAVRHAGSPPRRGLDHRGP